MSHLNISDLMKQSTIANTTNGEGSGIVDEFITHEGTGLPCMRQTLPAYFDKRTGRDYEERQHEYAWGVQLDDDTGEWYAMALLSEDAVTDDMEYIMDDGDYVQVALEDFSQAMLPWAMHHVSRLLREDTSEATFQKVLAKVMGEVASQMIVIMRTRSPVGGELKMRYDRKVLRFNCQCIGKTKELDTERGFQVKKGYEYWVAVTDKDSEAKESGVQRSSRFNRRRARQSRFINGR